MTLAINKIEKKKIEKHHIGELKYAQIGEIAV